MSTKMTRRSLIKTGGLICAATFSGLRYWDAKIPNGRLYLPFEDLKKDAGVNKYGLLSVDLETGEDHWILATPFSVHVLELSKSRPGIGLGVNKYGRFFAEIDLDKRSILKIHELKSELNLTGHICYSADESYLCGSAIDTREQKDCVVLFDPRSYKVNDVIYLKQNSPAHHDCKFIGNSHILATTAGQSIDYVNLNTREIKENGFDFGESRSSIRHFAVNTAGFICAQANTFDNLDSDWTYSQAKILTLENETRTIVDLSSIDSSISDAELLDFTFSADGKRFGVVHSRTGKVSFWDFQNTNMLKIHKISGAVRIALNTSGTQFIVIASQKIVYVDTHKLEVSKVVKTPHLKSHYLYSHRTLRFG